MAKLTNNTDGPKGVWVSDKTAMGGSKTVWIEPGETVDVDVSETEQKSFEAQGGTVEKRGPGRPPKDAE